MSTDSDKRTGLRLLLVIAALAVIGVLVWWLRPGEPLLQGQVEATQVNVGAKVPGRIDTVLVREGAAVKKGQVLATLATPEIQAKASQADAVVAAARALEDKAKNGAQPQDIDAARMQWQAAERGADLAQVTYARVQRLYNEGVLPQQKRDEAFAQAKATRAQADAANAVYRKAHDGARPEDLRAAQAQLAQAEGGRNEVQAYLDERQVRAPIAGEVSTRVLEPGEVAAAGAPIVVIADLSDLWVSFNLREDRLAGARIGREFEAQVPALKKSGVRMRIDYLAPLADFATWRSSRDLGGFDLRTFELRARPLQPVPGLRPGMSVLLPASTLASDD
ncbi:HlyD family secretion protein [Lysobacter cavernae]|uniref:HlyD family secretion protein n=1 Tax=Lysobacter cavernae TaxID=1685901 RepID=A0ABV7RQL4_9GAMM